MDITSILDAFASALADRLAEKLSAPRAPERIPLADVTQHGAPSARWVTAKAREGSIALHGPRGGRFVMRAELEAVLASTTIRRQRRAPVPGCADLAADARSAVAELAARRVGGAR